MDCIVYLNSNLMKDINPTDFFKMLVKKKITRKDMVVLSMNHPTKFSSQM